MNKIKIIVGSIALAVLASNSVYAQTDFNVKSIEVGFSNGFYVSKYEATYDESIDEVIVELTACGRGGDGLIGLSDDLLKFELQDQEAKENLKLLFLEHYKSGFKFASRVDDIFGEGPIFGGSDWLTINTANRVAYATFENGEMGTEYKIEENSKQVYNFYVLRNNEVVNLTSAIVTEGRKFKEKLEVCD